MALPRNPREKYLQISIIVPCYNAKTTIEKCVISLLDQDFPKEDYEIIIVDDASTDNCLDLIQDDHIKKIKAPSNKGPGVARNLGAEMAQGEILAFTDSDCIAPSHWLTKIKEGFDNGNHIAVFAGYNGTARNSPLENFALLECRFRQSALTYHLELSSTSNFSCYRFAFEHIKGFPIYSIWGKDPLIKPFWGSEDLEIAYLLYEAYEDKIIWDNENGVTHHFHSEIVKYAQQQAFFASASIVSYFKYPNIGNAGESSGRSSALSQIFSLFPLLLGLLGFKWSVFYIAPFASYLLIVVANTKLLKFINEQTTGSFPRWLYSSYLFVRNISWTYGFIRGLFWGPGVWFGKTHEPI
ncbi:MAG: glycosyltransferase family A protein [Candidatus Latescibacterota bacterium]|nr:glycosyltransferase family A protein [Candidatus Latescibacterota bacterium]